MDIKEESIDKVMHGKKFQLIYMGTVKDFTKTSTIEDVENFFSGKAEDLIRIRGGQGQSRWKIT